MCLRAERPLFQPALFATPYLASIISTASPTACAIDASSGGPVHEQHPGPENVVGDHPEELGCSHLRVVELGGPQRVLGVEIAADRVEIGHFAMPEVSFAQLGEARQLGDDDAE